ncbi:hypothetical protein AaE_009105 [Aphanomyces astaci]|uniref:Ubiquitin-like-conjugating enzyme ATG10 n=1 Tax=Aphanomyces astaci TaxID=112090 RepID=A0A6A5A5W5_APHAT|nr:hypothetical protein AaE_009105 [Aphanomyces astaci]
MSMSWESFHAAASALLTFQAALVESNHMYAAEWNWAWELAPPSSPLHKVLPGYGYLISRNNVREFVAAGTHDVPSSVDGSLEDAFVDDEDADCLVDMDPCVVPSPSQHASSVNHDMCMYEFHVVYSPTYKVPLLFLRGHYVDGALVPTSVVQAHMSTFVTKFISQDEHPVLGLPFYFLHPCETASCLSLLVPSATLSTSTTSSSTAPCPLQHLLAWLTLVQPCTHIRVPVPFAISYLRSSPP